MAHNLHSFCLHRHFQSFYNFYLFNKFSFKKGNIDLLCRNIFSYDWESMIDVILLFYICSIYGTTVESILAGNSYLYSTIKADGHINENWKLRTRKIGMLLENFHVFHSKLSRFERFSSISSVFLNIFALDLDYNKIAY